MRKVFHFDSPRERYQCDAAVVWCFDNRFDLAFRKFLKRSGVTRIDPVKIAGGAKSLATPVRESDRSFIVDQIRISMNLHSTEHVILMVHSDCGAYGGLADGFAGDERAEAAHHERELQKAANHLRSELPGIRVSTYFVNFEGVWEISAESAQGASA